MSMDKNYYIIAGYDLTRHKTDKFDDWKWTDEGEKYVCNQSRNHIQLFYDSMSNEHFYLGFILADGDEYYFKTTKIDMEIVGQVKGYVDNELTRLIDLGVVNADSKSNPKYEVIAFEECT